MAPMSDTPSTADSVQSQEAFPPTSIAAFLRFSAGEWLSLRSRFALDDDEADAA